MQCNAERTASSPMSLAIRRAGVKAPGKRIGASLRLPTRALVLAASLLAAGCAGMGETECRGANWYDVGYRDAQFKLQNQAGVYAERCERYGVKVDAARYEEGLRQGRWDFPDRMT